MNEEKITQWFINNVNGTPSEEQLALRKVYKLQQRIDKALNYIYKNYGVLDKYQIEILETILKGDSDE